MSILSNFSFLGDFSIRNSSKSINKIFKFCNKSVENSQAETFTRANKLIYYNSLKSSKYGFRSKSKNQQKNYGKFQRRDPLA